MARRKPTFTPLKFGLFGTRLVMMWERLLPALFPYVLVVMLIAVAGQWGLFLHMPRLMHIAVVAAAFAVAVVASVRAALRFRLPTFTELNTRLAGDNGMKPERLIGMRHETDQPVLRIGRAKAGIAEADPFALRYIALLAALLGFLILGPVPLSRWESGFNFAPPERAPDMALVLRN